MGGTARKLAARKVELLANIPPRGEKWEWHQEMSRVNQGLSDLLADKIQTTKSMMESLQHTLRQSQLLESREFSFCLYPEQDIVSALRDLSTDAER